MARVTRVPRARDGTDFQLANPDLVHQVDTLEKPLFAKLRQFLEALERVDTLYHELAGMLGEAPADLHIPQFLRQPVDDFAREWLDRQPAPQGEVHSITAVCISRPGVGWGGEDNVIDNPPQEENTTPPPTHAPNTQNCAHREKPALFGDPGTRETLRKNLKELGVTCIYKLLRTYSASQLLEAVEDLRRAQAGRQPLTNPTGYIRWLLSDQAPDQERP